MLKTKKSNPISEPAVRGEINVTPLVDVCLVLLIIFMVVTPMLQKGVDVALPETVDPAKMPEGQKQITISIKSDGSVFVQQNWVTNENLPAALKEIHDQNPEKTVVVKGDRRLKYKDVRKVMRIINEAGFTRVGLVIDKKTAGGAAA
jgi:biopolymer transport protein TolR